MGSEHAAACNPVALNQSAIGFLHELDCALHEFQAWQNALYRALVSEDPEGSIDLRADAYRRCGFGRWYDGLPAERKSADAALGDISLLHQRMHAAALELLGTHRDRRPIRVAVYDAFVEHLQNFKFALLKYQRRIVSEVCTLDPLTGAGNRYAMDMRLTEEWERARRSGLPCSLCLIDLDHFKQVNDTYGHAIGDSVLRTVSRHLKGDGRVYDNLFRYGGEEFLVCMPNTPLGSAATVLNRLCESLAQLPIPIGAGAFIHISASFGVAPLLVDEPIERSIEYADHALLAAKSAGRNRVCVWDVETPRP